jgi:ribose transport system ATP-binding protein
MSNNEIARLANIDKNFGAVRALVDVNLSLQGGIFLGLVGYNGAGKSTLMHVLAGTRRVDSGEIFVRGESHTHDYSPHMAHRLGIRCVFQELSLCPNLSVIENTKIFHRSLKGRGWRRNATRLIMDSLDGIFPNHGIGPRDELGTLSIAKRQMVEIARAFTVTEVPVDIVILDEPTSSLDVSVSDQLRRYIQTAASRGLSIILISHILNEIHQTSNIIAVMRDGSIVASSPANELDREKLINLMSGAAKEKTEGETGPGAALKEHEIGKVVITAADIGGRSKELVAHRGEVVGLAGLGGHGQTDMLLKLFHAELKRHGQFIVDGKVTFVAGDRQTDGIFLLWSIAKNISIGSYKRILRWLLINLKSEVEMAEKWRSLIGIKTSDVRNSITSLSGGNQQKVLFARALCSDAEIVLMDDPMRGVDVQTKFEIYEFIKGEARKGRCFIWYTTELEELQNCDRIYVFKNGVIVNELNKAELNRVQVLQSSFAELSQLEKLADEGGKG